MDYKFREYKLPSKKGEIRILYGSPDNSYFFVTVQTKDSRYSKLVRVPTVNALNYIRSLQLNIEETCLSLVPNVEDEVQASQEKEESHDKRIFE